MSGRRRHSGLGHTTAEALRERVRCEPAHDGSKASISKQRQRWGLGEEATASCRRMPLPCLRAHRPPGAPRNTLKAVVGLLHLLELHRGGTPSDNAIAKILIAIAGAMVPRARYRWRRPDPVSEKPQDLSGAGAPSTAPTPVRHLSFRVLRIMGRARTNVRVRPPTKYPLRSLEPLLCLCCC